MFSGITAQTSNKPLAQRLHWRLLWLLLLTLAAAMFALQTGPLQLTSTELLQCLLQDCADPMQQSILHQIRLPRVLLALGAGAGLALCGAMLQNLTRNPLADPYLFGLMSGAALGATVVSLLLPQLGVSAQWLNWSLPFAAFAGAILAVILVMTLSWRCGFGRVEALLLSGVAVSFMLSSISTLLLYLAEPFAANRVMFWLMGSLARADYQAVIVVLPLVLLALGLMAVFRRQLNALQLGDEGAAALGVPVSMLRLGLLLCCAAITAGIVAYCGGIAFVGLMVPHVIRLLLGNNTVPLMLGCALGGGWFLLAVDTLARSALPNQEIPLGVITSALGSVFFIVIMLSRYRR